MAVLGTETPIYQIGNSRQQVTVEVAPGELSRELRSTLRIDSDASRQGRRAQPPVFEIDRESAGAVYIQAVPFALIALNMLLEPLEPQESLVLTRIGLAHLGEPVSDVIADPGLTSLDLSGDRAIRPCFEEGCEDAESGSLAGENGAGSVNVGAFVRLHLDRFRYRPVPPRPVGGDLTVDVHLRRPQ